MSADNAVMESVLRVPAQLARSFAGLTADFGASLMKFIYQTQEDKDELMRGDSEYGQLRLVKFARRGLDSALMYVRQRAVVTAAAADGEENAERRPTIYTTGVGCTQHGTLIANTLAVKLQQLTEFNCVVKAFVYLASHIPRDELLEAPMNESIEQAVDAMKKISIIMMTAGVDLKKEDSFFDPNVAMSGFEAAIGRSSPKDAAGGTSLSDSEPDMFPCLVVICGSGFMFLKVEKDGSFKVVEGSNRGGRSFVGLGTLLTGCETCEELMELASNGTDRTLNEYTSDVNYASAADDDQSVYVAMAERLQDAPILLFAFGKSVGLKLGEFKREDLARTLLYYIVQDLVQTTLLVSRCNGVKRVFFSGGFCSTPLARSVITAEYVRRNIYHFLQGGQATGAFDFIKNGEYLGALGCVVSYIEQAGM